MVPTSRWAQDGRLLFWSMLRVPVLPLDQQIQLGLIWAHSPSCWQSADASDSSWLADARFTLSSVHLTTSHHRCPSVEKRWSRDQPAELPVSPVFFNHMTCILRDLTQMHVCITAVTHILDEHVHTTMMARVKSPILKFMPSACSVCRDDLIFQTASFLQSVS